MKSTELHKNNVRLRFIGERERLDAKLIEKIENAEALTADNSGLRLQVAVAYGGRWDIVAGGAHGRGPGARRARSVLTTSTKLPLRQGCSSLQRPTRTC